MLKQELIKVLTHIHKDIVNIIYDYTKFRTLELIENYHHPNFNGFREYVGVDFITDITDFRVDNNTLYMLCKITKATLGLYLTGILIFDLMTNIILDEYVIEEGHLCLLVTLQKELIILDPKGNRLIIGSLGLAIDITQYKTFYNPTKIFHSNNLIYLIYPGTFTEYKYAIVLSDSTYEFVQKITDIKCDIVHNAENIKNLRKTIIYNKSGIIGVEYHILCIRKYSNRRHNHKIKSKYIKAQFNDNKLYVYIKQETKFNVYMIKN